MPWLVTAQVASLLGRSPRTVRAWARDGRLPAFQAGRCSGRSTTYRFAADDVADFIATTRGLTPPTLIAIPAAA